MCPAIKPGLSANTAAQAKKYYLANLPAATSLRTLAATIKARWICEQAHQRLKKELGLPATPPKVTDEDSSGRTTLW